MTRKITVDIVIYLYILLFVYAAFTKLIDYQTFVVQLGQSPILTDHAKVLGVVIPVIELAISTMLIFSKTRLKGLYAAFGLMVMFTTYIVLASRFSDYVPCSCGGVLEGMTWTQHLIFNAAFVLFALTGILLHSSIRSVDSSTSLL